MMRTAVIKAQYRFAVQVSDTIPITMGLIPAQQPVHKNKFLQTKIIIIFE